MKLRVCFNCKEYITLVALGSGTWEDLKQESFDREHKNHPLATIEMDELDIEDFTLKDLYHNEKVTQCLFA
ncbi:MAG: hypothetical protein GY870_15940 [archaeon]|nr:hypothetical protein [archaeon]